MLSSLFEIGKPGQFEPPAQQCVIIKVWKILFIIVTLFVDEVEIIRGINYEKIIWQNCFIMCLQFIWVLFLNG